LYGFEPSAVSEKFKAFSIDREDSSLFYTQLRGYKQMAFIKVDHVVVNTNYIAAVRLEGLTRTGTEGVSLLIAIPTTSFLQQEAATGSYHYEWLEFTGASARALKDYFSSFNNVLDLLPTQPCCSGK
jgi:hypothetical protein